MQLKIANLGGSRRCETCQLEEPTNTCLLSPACSILPLQSALNPFLRLFAILITYACRKRNRPSFNNASSSFLHSTHSLTFPKLKVFSQFFLTFLSERKRRSSLSPLIFSFSLLILEEKTEGFFRSLYFFSGYILEVREREK